MKTDKLSPIKSSERFVILDSLRGFALLGIAIANFPEFSLYTFMSAEDTATLPLSWVDRWLRYLLYFFVDGKFYTIFSLLLGIGFSIIFENVARKGGNALSVFYRRMIVLALIGFVHLMFIWSGDILLLYALLGMLLPPLRKLSNRSLLTVAFILLLIPVVVDFLCEVTKLRLSEPVVRMQEFIDGNRYFKVLGLFLLGFYIGRQHLYARLEEKRSWLKKVFRSGLSVGLPVSVLYAYSAMNDHPWGMTVHSILYLMGVYPLAFAYMSGICLLFLRHPDSHVFRWFAAPGRMALTNYVGLSVVGMFVFYGIGLGLGSEISLFITELIVVMIYIALQSFSSLWFVLFRFGPLEWIWRMLTYGHWIGCRK